MVIRPFLAMTAAEIRANPDISFPVGWMACHFSPYGTGLSNLPEELPEESLLILNDRTPWWNHDPGLIGEQLAECIDQLSCHGLLLDFQRPGISEVAELVSLLCTGLPCPVAVTEAYCTNLSCPVFLPPVPLQQTVEEYLAPWQGREVWLELALDCEAVTLTTEGAATTPLSRWAYPAEGYSDRNLHCYYHIEPREDRAVFTLRRTREDLDGLLEDAANCGVTTAVGLWQELNSAIP